MTAFLFHLLFSFSLEILTNHPELQRRILRFTSAEILKGWWEPQHHSSVHSPKKFLWCCVPLRTTASTDEDGW